jgi:hypothetical protein
MIMLPIGVIQQGGSSPPVAGSWDNIYAAWEFDGAAANSSGYWKDETGTIHITSELGSPTYVTSQITGLINDARYNDLGYGNAFLRTGNAGLNSSLTSLTFIGWVKPMSTKAAGYHFHLSTNGREDGNGISIYSQSNGVTMVAHIRYGGDSYISRTCTADVWNMFSLTLNHLTATWQLKVNGGTAGSYVGKGLAIQGVTFQAGFSGSWGGTGGGGAIDMCRIFKRVLTDDQILSHYNSGAGRAYLA